MTFSILAVFLAIFTVFAQPSPPMQGIQLGNLSLGIDFRFPETVAQCEPVLIYCDTIRDGYSLYLLTPDRHVFLRVPIPTGTRYIEWVCDIPAGYGFIASYYSQHGFVVRSGSSSSCLRNITTSYAYAVYDTTVFQSYTAHLPNTTAPFIQTHLLPTCAYLSISTITRLKVTDDSPVQLFRYPLGLSQP